MIGMEHIDIEPARNIVDAVPGGKVTRHYGKFTTVEYPNGAYIKIYDEGFYLVYDPTGLVAYHGNSARLAEQALRGKKS